MTTLPEDIFEARSRALLKNLQRQITTSTVSVVIVILFIAGLAINDSQPSALVISWAAAGISMLFVRYYILVVKNVSVVSFKKQLDNMVVLYLAFGLLQAFSVVFFESFDDASQTIYTIIIVASCTGHVIGSQGHLPLFLAFAAPQLSALAAAWLIFAPEEASYFQQTTILGIGVLAVFLITSCRDLYRAFEENIALATKIQSALDLETKANASKTRFLAAASHDLRQPLQTMSMLSAALTLRPLDDESARIANRISEAMAELSAELDSLLDISKMDSGVTRLSISDFQVNSLVERLVNAYRPAANEKNLQLCAKYSSNSTLKSDKILLERVLRNLLDNAIKYTDSGSIDVRVSERNSRCVIQIEDTGVGIPEAEQQRIFEEFYQLLNPQRNRKSGLGLGLSIVSRIVRLLKAELELVSNPGKGSLFTLSLPSIVTSNPIDKGHFKDAVTEKTSKTSGQMFAKVHTLVVEDDQEVRLSMRTLLESVGSRVSEAANTCDAIDIAALDVPDIALVDLRLPGEDSGYKTISELRKLVPTIPVIIISGELTSNDSQYFRIDNCEYFAKPVEMNALFEQMRQMLKPNGENNVPLASN